MSWSISVARLRPLTLGFKLAPERLLLRSVMVDHTQSTSRFSHSNKSFCVDTTRFDR